MSQFWDFLWDWRVNFLPALEIICWLIVLGKTNKRTIFLDFFSVKIQREMALDYVD